MSTFGIGTIVTWANHSFGLPKPMIGETAAFVAAGGNLREAWRRTVELRNARDRHDKPSPKAREDTYLVLVYPKSGRGKPTLYIRPAKTLTAVDGEQRGQTERAE